MHKLAKYGYKKNRAFQKLYFAKQTILLFLHVNALFCVESHGI